MLLLGLVSVFVHPLECLVAALLIPLMALSSWSLTFLSRWSFSIHLLIAPGVADAGALVASARFTGLPSKVRALVRKSVGGALVGEGVGLASLVGKAGFCFLEAGWAPLLGVAVRLVLDGDWGMDTGGSSGGANCWSCCATHSASACV